MRKAAFLGAEVVGSDTGLGFLSRTIGSITGIGDGPVDRPFEAKLACFGSTIPIDGPIAEAAPDIGIDTEVDVPSAELEGLEGMLIG